MDEEIKQEVSYEVTDGGKLKVDKPLPNKIEIYDVQQIVGQLGLLYNRRAELDAEIAEKETLLNKCQELGIQQ